MPTEICCCQSWAMTDAACASGRPDLRKGKFAAQQQLGERSEKCERTAPQHSRSVQEELQTQSRCSLQLSLMVEQAISLQPIGTTWSRSPHAAVDETWKRLQPIERAAHHEEVGLGELLHIRINVKQCLKCEFHGTELCWSSNWNDVTYMKLTQYWFLEWWHLTEAPHDGECGESKEEGMQWWCIIDWVKPSFFIFLYHLVGWGESDFSWLLIFTSLLCF